MQLERAKSVLFNDQMVLVYSLFLFVLIVISLFVPIFVYAVFFLGLFYIITTKVKNSLLLLFFLLPFAGILKFQIGDPSFLTYLKLVFLVVFVFRNYRKSLDFTKLFFLPLLFIMSMLNSPNIIRIADIIINIVFLFFVISIIEDTLLKKIIFIYAIGLLLASIITLFEPRIPRMGALMRFVVHWLEDGTTTKRFSGLENDPNYYSMPVILLLSSLLVLLKKKQIKETVFYLYAIPLSFFGILTLSKSFIIIYFLFIIAYFIVIFQINNIRALVTIFILLVGALIVIRSTRFSALTILLNRLTSSFSSGETDINVILTGRWGIWIKYWTEINKNLTTLLFGHGTSAGYVGGNASHSMYIEILYHYGIIGFILIAANILMITFSSRNRIGHNFIYYSPIIFLLMLSAALDMIKEDKVFYYLVIAIGAIYKPNNNSKNGLTDLL